MLNDVFNDGKSHAHATGFSGEVRLEKFVTEFNRYASAIVHQLDNHFIFSGFQADADFPIPVLRYGLNGIFHQVDENP